MYRAQSSFIKDADTSSVNTLIRLPFWRYLGRALPLSDYWPAGRPHSRVCPRKVDEVVNTCLSHLNLQLVLTINVGHVTYTLNRLLEFMLPPVCWTL